MERKGPKEMNPVTAIVLFLCAVIRSSALTSPPSPYEVLKSYNLPVGLLPKGAVGYDLDAGTGEFAVRFNSTCSFSLQDSYQIRYQPSITGRISDSRLRDLKGVSVKILFVWVNIVEVDRDRDQLEFSVGIVSADFPVENFDECPQCGCGMDCGDDSKEEEEEARGVKLRSQI